MCAIPYRMGLLRTDDEASATTDAFLGEKQNFWLKADAFRVLTPETVKRTTLKKNSRSNSGSIMNREPLNVEDSPFHLFKAPKHTTIYISIFFKRCDGEKSIHAIP